MTTPAEKRRRLRDRQYWTAAEAAFMLGRRRQVINRWISDDQLAVIRFPGVSSRFVRAEQARTVHQQHARRDRTSDS